MTGHGAPLAGLRVLEISAHAAWPLGGQTLAGLESIAALLAPWFARRTAADLAAAFAGTSVPWERRPAVRTAAC